MCRVLEPGRAAQCDEEEPAERLPKTDKWDLLPPCAPLLVMLLRRVAGVGEWGGWEGMIDAAGLSDVSRSAGPAPFFACSTPLHPHLRGGRGGRGGCQYVSSLARFVRDPLPAKKGA